MQIGANEKFKVSDAVSRAIIREVLAKGFRDEIDLFIFLEYGLREPRISTKVNCGKNHTSQFRFLSSVLLGKVEDFIVWANRSGSKSYLAGLIAWVESGMFSRCETNILGGSLEQSEKSYKAMNDFWELTGLREELLEVEPLISETRWRNKSRVHILTASQKSVRGGHPQRLILDEVDEMDEDIFEAALSQPQSKYGIKSRIGIFSTNHRAEGTMEKALKMAEEKGGYTLFKWCIWDVLESCKDYSCSRCKLATYCPGKHMKKADGYYKVEDFIKKLSQLSEYTLFVEWFCEKVGRGDLVYGKEFDPDIHLVDREFKPGKDVYLSIDWGGTNPFSIGVWQNFDDLGWVRVDEIYKGHTTNKYIIDEAKKRPWWKFIRGVVADPERADLIDEWKEALPGIPVEKADNRVEVGIEAVRDALRPVVGNPKIYFNKFRCKDIIREFKAYRERNGKPVKENDHAMDDMRYFVMWRVKEKKKKGFSVSIL